jgi:hypothetical protein
MPENTFPKPPPGDKRFGAVGGHAVTFGQNWRVRYPLNMARADHLAIAAAVAECGWQDFAREGRGDESYAACRKAEEWKHIRLAAEAEARVKEETK